MAAALIVAVHLALLAVLVMQPGPRVPVRPVVMMTVRTIVAPPPPPPLPTIVPVTIPTLPVPSISARIIEPPTPVPPCDILGTLGSALANDPATTAALAAMATGPDRAIMLWDGEWSRSVAALPLRRAIVASLGDVSSACRDELLTGPRLVFVPVADTTITIAIGSGKWKWQQLLSLDQFDTETTISVPSR